MRRLFIIRKDLNLSAGKLAAMVGHCCEAYWTNLIKANTTGNTDVLEDGANGDYTVVMHIPREIMDDYVYGIFTKTICECKNLEQLKKAEKIALELGLKEGVDFGYINDKCLTELKPENEDGTCTIGIWFRPLSDDTAHKISKKYKLYGAFDDIDLKCWKVMCIDKNNQEYEVGVMTSTADKAMRNAVSALKEGRHIDSIAVSVRVADAI